MASDTVLKAGLGISVAVNIILLVVAAGIVSPGGTAVTGMTGAAAGDASASAGSGNGSGTAGGTGTAAVPAGEISADLSISAGGGGGYNDRSGYFLPSGGAVTLTASEPSKIFVDGVEVQSCDSAPCAFTGTFGRGVHLYYASADGRRTAVKFFVLGLESRTSTPECTDPSLDYSRDGFVEFNDMHKLIGYLGTGTLCPGCDISGDGALTEADLFLLASRINACL